VTSDVHSLTTAQRERGPLDGIGIVVTRPLRQAAVLATRIATLGGVPIIWPAIVILPPPDGGPLERAHATLANYVTGARTPMREVLGARVDATVFVIEAPPSVSLNVGTTNTMVPSKE